MRHYEVKIKRDTQTTYVVQVPEWEIPLLEYVFEQGNIDRLEGVVKFDREYPSADYEFDRLARAYGKDPQTGETYVSKVYGNAGIGIRALKKLMIDERTAEDSEPVHVAKVAQPKRQRQAAPSAGDPLLA
jgi:hypothetical protein